MSLTDKEIRAARPKARPYKLSDGKGLFLLVQPSGGLLWRFKYRVIGIDTEGKPKRVEKKLALGIYPDISLKDARARRDAARKLLADGIDPSEHKQQKKVAANLGAVNTFTSMAEQVIEKNEREGLTEPAGARADRDGSQMDDPVRLLTVGRAVEKKGHDILIAALAALPKDLSWRWVHIGGGGLLKQLKRQADAAGINGRIDWLGSLPQEKVLEHYRSSDLFVLANRIAGDGDRDGLPNVLLEAQSQGLACVASEVSGVPELIKEGINGRLVPANDPDCLTAILNELIVNPQKRNLLGAAGRQTVAEHFSFDTAIGRLAAKFGLETASPEKPDSPDDDRTPALVKSA